MLYSRDGHDSKSRLAHCPGGGGDTGAGRAIAVELARAGLFVYATGRSSRVSGWSEIDRPETIEETGFLVRAAGGMGSALVDHEDPASVALGDDARQFRCHRGYLARCLHQDTRFRDL